MCVYSPFFSYSLGIYVFYYCFGFPLPPILFSFLCYPPIFRRQQPSAPSPSPPVANVSRVQQNAQPRFMYSNSEIVKRNTAIGIEVCPYGLFAL